jgi:RimJ/RimL family protein N-acetyltransferase
VTLLLQPIDEPAAKAIASGGCPPGLRCAPDYPAEGDRIAATMFLERCEAGLDPRPYSAFLVCLPADPAAGPEVTVTGIDEAIASVIGGIGFHGGVDEAGRVEIGYGIVASERRKGHATQALRLLIDHARELGAATLFAETEVDNEPSQAVLQRVGFIRYARDASTLYFELALGPR